MTIHDEPGRESVENVKRVDSVNDYDEIVRHMGQLGPWQWRVAFWAILASGSGGLAMVTFGFTGYVPKYRCSIKQCESVGQSSFYANPAEKNFSTDIRAGTPFFEKKLDEDQGASGKSCEVYGTYEASSCEELKTYVETAFPPGSGKKPTAKDVQHCALEDIIFDDAVVSSSVVTSFNLYCDREYWRSIISSCYMVGVFIGALFLGKIGDTYGRVPGLAFSFFLCGICGILGAFAPEAVSFTILRILTGCGAHGLFSFSFLITLEFMGPAYASLLALLIDIPFAFGEMVLATEAYIIRDWVLLQLVCHGPIVFFAICYIFLPESPRYLLAVGRIEDAKKVVRRGCELNGKSFPEHLFSTTDHEAEVNLKNIAESIQLDEDNAPKGEKEETQEEQIGVMDLVRTPRMRWRTINMCWQWVTITLCYYGLSSESTKLGGSPHFNLFLSALMEIPGYLFVILLINCWGRRPALTLLQTLSGVCCIISGLLAGKKEYMELEITTAMLGKFGASGAFALIFLYTAELYPTAIRSRAGGVCAACGRIGAVSAYLIELLANIWKPLPVLLMGTLAAVGGIFAIMLPETAGVPLPETMEDALNIDQRPTRKGKCSCIWPKSMNDIFFNHEPEKNMINSN